MSEWEVFKDLGGDAVFTNGAVIGQSTDNISNVVGVACESGGVCFGSGSLDLPGKVVDVIGFAFFTMVELDHEISQRLSPFFTILVSINFVRQFRRRWCFHGLCEVPIMASGLFQKFVVFTVPALLLLVFLQADMEGHLEIRVVVRVVNGISQFSRFNLRFRPSSLVVFGGVQEGGRKLIKPSRGGPSPIEQDGWVPSGWGGVC